MEDILDKTKEVFGIEDSPEDRKEELESKKAKGDDTDRDRKEIADLEEKMKDSE